MEETKKIVYEKSENSQEDLYATLDKIQDCRYNKNTGKFEFPELKLKPEEIEEIIYDEEDGSYEIGRC